MYEAALQEEELHADGKDEKISKLHRRL